MKVDLTTEIAGIRMKNPVMVASGTFGFGREYSQFIDLNELGALVVKTITLEEREGNPEPRVWETPSGMLNSIGLQNKGVDYFLKEELPWLISFDVPIIVSIGGDTIQEYTQVAEQLSQVSGISALEINISCPNVKQGGMLFGTDPALTSEVVRAVKQVAEVPVIVKLTPNVTDIAEIAYEAERAEADAISLINTVRGMAINVETFKPCLGSGLGGLSGPAIKPIAVRMIWEVAQAVAVPIIGMGGIVTAEDAVEFFLAGAQAIAIGTANFINPRAVRSVIQGLERFLRSKSLASVKELVGRMEVDSDD